MRIGITYDLKKDWTYGQEDLADADAEFDKPETVNAVIEAIASCGHEVIRIGNVHRLLERINDLDVDIVFNLCEGAYGRNRESQVPVLLEIHGIPCVGADGLTLGLTLDKVMAKKCFIADGIPTPRFFVARNTDNLKEDNHIGYPLMVKTRYEGSSKGISKDSRVQDLEGLKRQVGLITGKYDQPALVEEFIRGTEFTVAVLGNGRPQAMPISQVSIDDKAELGDEFYTFERISSNSLQYICPAQISAELTEKIQDLAIRAYKSVDCRDFGRVDFRVDEAGNPYVLEINPLPSLSKEDVFNLFPQVLGSTYEETLNRVIQFASQRSGINPAKTENRQAA